MDCRLQHTVVAAVGALVVACGSADSSPGAAEGAGPGAGGDGSDGGAGTTAAATSVADGTTGHATVAVDDGGTSTTGADDAPCTSWLQVDGVPGVDYYDLSWIDADEGWIVGLAGTALHTTDAGRSWAPVDVGTTDDLRTVGFHPGSRSGWVVGGAALDSYESLPTTIRRTTDGGASWSMQNASIFFPPTKVHALGPDQAWLVWGLGELHPDGHWLRTDDGGASWNPPPGDFIRPGRAMMDVFFIDASTGWMVSSNNEVLVTIDGVDVETPIAGPGKLGIFHTLDGGASWELQPTPVTEPVYFTGVHFADATHGFVVDATGTILATDDGGDAWDVAGSAPAGLNGVYAAASTRAWAVGGGGTIVTTTDGTNWSTQTSPTTSTLRRVSGPAGGGNPWAVGDGGTVLRCVATSG